MIVMVLVVLTSLNVLEEAHTLYQEKKAGGLTSSPNLAESGGMLLLMKGEHSNSGIIRWNNEL